MSDQMREKALARAAQDFIDKVDRGEARSVASYAAFKSALALTASPLPAPGIKEAFELFNGIVGSPDANGLVTVKIHKDCLGRIHNIAATPSRPGTGGGVRGEWFTLREDGVVYRKELTGHNTARYVVVCRDCSLEDANFIVKARAALSKPTDASNVSAEARLPNWGQIVQILLRCMDATIKNETSREQAERMANELLEKYPALSAVGGEAKKSDGLCHCSWGCVEADNCRFREARKQAEESPIKPGPSDPTADVTEHQKRRASKHGRC